MSKKLSFKGPVFIVGMGRSGTKLIRTLLNNHNNISLPTTETQFIPHLIEEMGINKTREFEVYIEYLKKTMFFHRVQRHRKLNEDAILQFKSEGTVADFIETILKYYSYNFKNFKDYNYIWGDKTPYYVSYIDLLKNTFPKSRILHIVRDPRDVALSHNKTWGKSIYGPAEEWRSTMENTTDRNYLENSWYKEIFYETLISDPDKIMQSVCSFLDIKYDHNMLKIESPVENLGDARSSSIESNNKNKFKNFLSDNQIKRVESIVKPYLQNKGYELEYNNVKYNPLNNMQKIVYKTIDFIMFITHHLFKGEGIKGTGVILANKIRKIL